MDDTRFDRLTRAVGALTSRRVVLRAAGGTALAALILTDADADAKKKKKKKCKKPKVKCGKKCCAAGSVCAAGACAPACRFVKTENETLWTLQGDCATNAVIEIPDGVTLDGNGKTIRLFAQGARLETTGVTATVRNLTLDGGGRCLGSGLVFNRTSGQVQDATIANFGCASGGIEILGTNGASVVQVDVDNATVSQFPGAGISYFAVSTGSVTNSTVQTADIGVNVNTSTVTVDGNTFENVTAGVRVLAAGGAATATVTNNTIVGFGPIPGFTTGVDFLLSGAGGSVVGNTISNFFDSVGSEGCGIFVDAVVAAGAVTIGTNTFPDPPGNEQNVCDNRP